MYPGSKLALAQAQRQSMAALHDQDALQSFKSTLVEFQGKHENTFEGKPRCHWVKEYGLEGFKTALAEKDLLHRKSDSMYFLRTSSLNSSAMTQETTMTMATTHADDGPVFFFFRTSKYGNRFR